MSYLSIVCFPPGFWNFATFVIVITQYQEQCSETCINYETTVSCFTDDRNMNLLGPQVALQSACQLMSHILLYHLLKSKETNTVINYGFL